MFTFYLLVLDIHTRKLLIEGKPLDCPGGAWGWVQEQRAARR